MWLLGQARGLASRAFTYWYPDALLLLLGQARGLLAGQDSGLRTGQASSQRMRQARGLASRAFTYWYPDALLLTGQASILRMEH
jgi:hypothetical protein